MGLCASKSDQVRDSDASKRAKPQIRKTHDSRNKSNQAKGTQLRNGTGHRVHGEVDENKDILSAQEAARLAAEKRLQESNSKATQGALGKRLAEERSKSYKTQMMKEAERRQLEKATKGIVYD
ncbi:hypothetical protein HG536_0D02030 [Torulaspora globosa]|uniref:Uncharacterized protein n=1 Tax=Torulaspora globosa TaxID=48254 RepID=A0A7G3ZGP5_9SACH|nr:uncharacterized protein HG536_0D02030 [Torulaspora globosa]QLL32681.1 hypothetical protein HG536_0D02030 [Torulaspora globosa]